MRDQQSADLGILLVPYLLPQFSTYHNPSKPLPVREKENKRAVLRRTEGDRIRRNKRRKEEKRELTKEEDRGGIYPRPSTWIRYYYIYCNIFLLYR